MYIIATDQDAINANTFLVTSLKTEYQTPFKCINVRGPFSLGEQKAAPVYISYESILARS